MLHILDLCDKYLTSQKDRWSSESEIITKVQNFHCAVGCPFPMALLAIPKEKELNEFLFSSRRKNSLLKVRKTFFEGKSALTWNYASVPKFTIFWINSSVRLWYLKLMFQWQKKHLSFSTWMTSDPYIHFRGNFHNAMSTSQSRFWKKLLYIAEKHVTCLLCKKYKYKKCLLCIGWPHSWLIFKGWPNSYRTLAFMFFEVQTFYKWTHWRNQNFVPWEHTLSHF